MTGVASSSVVPYDANTGDTFPSPLPNADPELLRLRATYRLLTKAFGVLRYLFPVTGGLACWVAAGASLGGVFASLVPQMVNVVNVLAFALAVVMGGSVSLTLVLAFTLVSHSHSRLRSPSASVLCEQICAGVCARIQSHVGAGGSGLVKTIRLTTSLLGKRMW